MVPLVLEHKHVNQGHPKNGCPTQKPTHKPKKTEEHNNLDSISLNDVSSELDLSSDADDKTRPGYWRKDEPYLALPENVRAAIELSRERSKHSDFYY